MTNIPDWLAAIAAVIAALSSWRTKRSVENLTVSQSAQAIQNVTVVVPPSTLTEQKTSRLSYPTADPRTQK